MSVLNHYNHHLFKKICTHQVSFLFALPSGITPYLYCWMNATYIGYAISTPTLNSAHLPAIKFVSAINHYNHHYSKQICADQILFSLCPALCHHSLLTWFGSHYGIPSSAIKPIPPLIDLQRKGRITIGESAGSLRVLSRKQIKPLQQGMWLRRHALIPRRNSELLTIVSSR